MSNMKKIKIVFSIFPVSYWLALFVGLIIRFFGDEYLTLSNVILNFLLMLFFIKMSVILHEFGHLFFAKILGGRPRRMVLGNGHEVFRFEFHKIKIIINIPLRGGLAFSVFENLNLLRLRYLIYTAGGLITNLITILIVYFLFGFDADFILGRQGVSFSSAFIFATSVLFIVNVIPYHTRYSGIKIANDGLKIFQLLFKKQGAIEKDRNANDLLDAYEYLELKEYDKAEEIYKKCLKANPAEIAISINLSVIYLRRGDYNGSLEILTNAENLLNEKRNSVYKPLVYNNLAWLNLMKGNINEADRCSEIAWSLDQRNLNFQGTRGSVLIEMGDTERGIYFLKSLVNFDFVDDKTLTAAMYLVLGYSLLGKEKEKNRYLDLVTAHMSKFGEDDKLIWGNIIPRINEKVTLS